MKTISERVKKLVTESKKCFRNPLAEFVYFRTYSRWIDKEKRRETWLETVKRYMDFMKENLGKALSRDEYEEIHRIISKQEVMPSMRLLWAAGPAAQATNVSAFNCAYLAPTDLKDFGEIIYILMCGSGVGFSVERHNIQKLPPIKRQIPAKRALPTHIIKDSREGWGDALVLGLKTWFGGHDINFDYSKVRPRGARLKTLGGRSSGPEPLKALLEFAKKKILANQGRRLKPIDVHDIICKIGDSVVMGGVRRSALLSLSDLDDLEMRLAKTGPFYLTEPQRSMANNSVAYHKKPSWTEFSDEWAALVKSGTGERGIFNREGLKFQLPARRWKTFKSGWADSGTNPCGEIILKSKEFCNLSEVVSRPEDTKATLTKKVRIAAILGTYQSTLTNFPYLSKEWRNHCDQERLLGVSVTGQWDCPAVRYPQTLAILKKTAVETNRLYAKKFGISPSLAVTCVKPSGTVSQLTDAAAGLHARHAPYYIRRIRIAATDSLFQMLKDQKVPYKPEVGQSVDEATTYVLEFPVKAPANSVFKNDLTALAQLKYWKTVKKNFTEHNPSVTISVGKKEWNAVAKWLYKNWDILGGLSFLPREKHVYKLAPYEEINKRQYEELVKNFPKVDFSQIIFYEKEDGTQGAHELACVGGVCDIF